MEPSRPVTGHRSGRDRRVARPFDRVAQLVSPGRAGLDLHRERRHVDADERSVVEGLEGFDHGTGGAVVGHVADLECNHLSLLKSDLIGVAGPLHVPCI